MAQKRRLSFWEIWNMSFGFLGIQFGFALQGGFMSNIFSSLGANKDEIPILWIAAPLTGLIVQPIIGYLSDKTWHARWGRRRPYFLIGAVLSSIALFFVPYSPLLWIAGGFLWILDASINISMEPFRALVADKLDESQRSFGFVVQTLIIGIGTWVASNLPDFVSWMGVSNEAGAGEVAPSVKVAFAVGAFVFMISILITVFTTKEDSPEDMEAFLAEKRDSKNTFFKDIAENIGKMPATMRKLGVVQFFSWFAFFAMWSLYNGAVTEHVYNAPSPIEAQYDMTNEASLAEYNAAKNLYQEASNDSGSKMGIYGLSSMAFALLLVLYTSRKRINRKYIHMFSLIAGGFGFLIMKWIPDPSWLNVSFILIGIAWGSILSMPYAMLSSAIDPKKMGVMMGIFNMFIVIPQICSSLFFWLNGKYQFLGEQSINVMLVAGGSLLIAGFANLLITNPSASSYQPTKS